MAVEEESEVAQESAVGEGEKLRRSVEKTLRSLLQLLFFLLSRCLSPFLELLPSASSIDTDNDDDDASWSGVLVSLWRGRSWW